MAPGLWQACDYASYCLFSIFSTIAISKRDLLQLITKTVYPYT